MERTIAVGVALVAVLPAPASAAPIFNPSRVDPSSRLTNAVRARHDTARAAVSNVRA